MDKIGEIEKIMKHWEAERGGIGLACFNHEHQRQDAFDKANWEALTAIKAVLSHGLVHQLR